MQHRTGALLYQVECAAHLQPRQHTLSSPARPAIVFLNGEYYGTTVIQPIFGFLFVKRFFTGRRVCECLRNAGKFVLRVAGVSKLVSADLTVQKNADALEKSWI